VNSVRCVALPCSLSFLEERSKLGDLANGLRLAPAARQGIERVHLPHEDRALKLAQRGEDQHAAVAGLHVPKVLAEVTFLATNLEFMAAIGALNGCPTTAHKRVVKLVLGAAALTSDVHFVRSALEPERNTRFSRMV
jgi:hypothetical protein